MATSLVGHMQCTCTEGSADVIQYEVWRDPYNMRDHSLLLGAKYKVACHRLTHMDRKNAYQ